MQKLIYATSAGMTEEAFEAEAKAFLDTAKHPRFDVLYTQTVYQPMLELLAFLRANGFKTFVVSGGGADFMRVYSEEILDTPRDDIVGSSPGYKFQQTPDGFVLIRQPEMEPVNVNEMKPINIQRHIGRRPILAGGNSDGDLEMFQYTGGGGGPYLNLVIVHDDAEREYEYLTGTDKLMTAAAQSPWTFVSMKKDFKTIFPAVTQPATAPQAQIANPASENCVKQRRHAVHRDSAVTEGSTASACSRTTGNVKSGRMFRGDCPVGGLKVTGYVDAGRPVLRDHGGRLRRAPATAARTTNRALAPSRTAGSATPGITSTASALQNSRSEEEIHVSQAPGMPGSDPAVCGSLQRRGTAAPAPPPAAAAHLLLPARRLLA